MKLVLDTNVLVSGLLNQSGPPGLILQHIAFPDIIICWDKRIMAEYQEVLSRPKFHFPRSLLLNCLTQLYSVVSKFLQTTFQPNFLIPMISLSLK